jgi:hypothetical protein
MRPILLSALLALPLAACASPEMVINAAPLVEPAPELRELDRFVGTWTGTSEIVGPNVEEAADAVRGMMPEFEGEMPTTFKGGSKTSWALGEMFLRTETWSEMPDGTRMNYVDFKTWDATGNHYRSWHFGDSGETGEGTFTLDPDGSTFHLTATGVRTDGTPANGKGTMTFIDDDTLEWTWSESSENGMIEFRGKQTRK